MWNQQHLIMQVISAKGFPFNFKIKMIEVTYKTTPKIRLGKVVLQFCSHVYLKLSEIRQIENSNCILSFNKILQVSGTLKCQLTVT